ncbi:hypothetical protein MUK42_34978 [Musa troglodytarum]|uniref:Uncharacterized protein n=1 Tax=Musa troglodytarum TaxID=320322 RepID=A0A9E7EGA0_9LILI|nr:hypothetical protein MUK42_34978 [Musa troglodytarum]
MASKRILVSCSAGISDSDPSPPLSFYCFFFPRINQCVDLGLSDIDASLVDV